ncbi:2-phosphosulfolactate phosphatase [Paenibacillus algorifonticola]|uniref:Probable 2-phosphosulfolactate phosphatase n=1 Tax=Paenibacillus algorifonticola TaxID=684063 RepID=A0A1I2ELJ0_9BACL|nr:2-phosphosulfolactate phosphatase [Paenibacillus algorifonticola]SFE93477.1 2-phosphosulfolactate phosphatase [Paenibacillus algorifonticola]
MQIQVISSVNEASSTRFHHKTAIIVDVLRAGSTIVTALAAGAAAIIPVETVMEAKAAQQPGDLLGGERFCRKIAGFDLGNSPSEYDHAAVSNRRIILTTTNGTRALQKAARADYVLTAALLNATASAQAAAALRRDIVILCAGYNDEFAAEDGFCAGLLLDRLQLAGPAPVELDDFGLAMLAFYRNRSSYALETLASGVTGKRLAKIGLQRDIEACAPIDLYKEVPQLLGGMLTRMPI